MLGLGWNINRRDSQAIGPPYQVDSKGDPCSQEGRGKHAAAAADEETWSPQAGLLQDDGEAETFHYKEPLQNSTKSETGAPWF